MFAFVFVVEIADVISFVAVVTAVMSFVAIISFVGVVLSATDWVVIKPATTFAEVGVVATEDKLSSTRCPLDTMCDVDEFEESPIDRIRW